MKKNKTAVLERMRQKISPEQREFVKMNLSIARQIGYLLKKQGLTQKEFAEKLEKNESEVSRYLSGLHNVSLKTLAKIKVALGEDIITTPIEACEKYKTFVFVPLGSYAKTNQESNIEYSENSNIRVSYRKQNIPKAS